MTFYTKEGIISIKGYTIPNLFTCLDLKREKRDNVKKFYLRNTVDKIWKSGNMMKTADLYW